MKNTPLEEYYANKIKEEDYAITVAEVSEMLGIGSNEINNVIRLIIPEEIRPKKKNEKFKTSPYMINQKQFDILQTALDLKKIKTYKEAKAILYS